MGDPFRGTGLRFMWYGGTGTGGTVPTIFSPEIGKLFFCLVSIFNNTLAMKLSYVRYNQ